MVGASNFYWAASIAARTSSSSTWVYRCVVATDAWPNSVWTARRLRVPRRRVLYRWTDIEEYLRANTHR